MFIIKNTLHLDINVMPIGALAATFITVTLISFSGFLAFPLPDPDKDKKNEKAKKKESVVGRIFDDYFIKPIFAAISIWIISWIFMAFWGFFPDDFWQSSEERSKLAKCIVDKQNEIDSLKKIAADQNEVIEKHIDNLRVLDYVFKKLKKNYPELYSWWEAFFNDSIKDI